MHKFSTRIVVALALCFTVLPLAFSKVGNGLSEPTSFNLHDPVAVLTSPSIINGVWYLGWTESAYGSSRMPSELMRLKTELAANYVGLIILFFQDFLTSIDPHPDPGRTPSLATMARVIEEAHRLELGVILLPYLVVDSKHQSEGATLEDWVGHLQPEDVETWFDNYREILHTYAAFAEETSVEIMLVGWEFEPMLPHHSEWQSTITELRDLYSGKLSYLTNWWADRDKYAEVLNWTPWRSLDFIGVSAYFELTKDNDPTVGELKQAWYEDAAGQNIVEDLEALFAQYEKPIVFWELGYQSKDGANGAPWNFVLCAPPDEGEQADALAAAFQVLENQPWFAGQVIWAEEAGLRKTPDSYGVLDKKAARIIKSYVFGLDNAVDAVLYEASGMTVGMFTNLSEAIVSGLHVEFDREVTILNKIEIGGYLPMLEEPTGTTFNFGEGEVKPGGMVELDWEPAAAGPILVRWTD